MNGALIVMIGSFLSQSTWLLSEENSNFTDNFLLTSFKIFDIYNFFPIVASEFHPVFVPFHLLEFTVS